MARHARALSPEEALLRSIFGVPQLDYARAYHADAVERVRLVKEGIPAKAVEAVARQMLVPKERLTGTLGLARATVDRKARDDKPLSPDDSSKVLGMVRLIGQVLEMVEQSGSPEGFDAAQWVAGWLERPLPALGGHRPAEYMDTADGQALVSSLVARMQSGAYT